MQGTETNRPTSATEGWATTIEGGAAAATEAAVGTPENTGEAPEEQLERQGLGGLGDEPPELAPGEDLGQAAEEEEEQASINPFLSRPFSEPYILHSALEPERHDLDPYIPIGIKLGSFLLFPEVETGVIATNNVLGTKTDPHADAAYELAPSLLVQSDWSRHSLSFLMDVDRSWYGEFPIEDDNIYEFLLKGRIDVTRRTHLSGELETSQTQAGRNSVSLTDIAGAQINLHEQHAIGAVDHTFNRLTLKLAQAFADYNYDNFDQTVEGGVPFQDVRDYSEAVTTLRGTYEFNAAWAGFVEGAVNNREYDEPITSAGLRRGSDGFQVLTGADLRLAGTLFGEFGIGWGGQQPIDDRFTPISGFLINGDIIWMPSSATKVEFLARSEIDETTLETSMGAIDRFFEVSVQHAFWRYLVLGSFVSYEVADYFGDPQVDQRLRAGLTADYYFNPVLSLYSRYVHTDFTSTVSENDFVEDEVRVGIKLRR